MSKIYCNIAILAVLCAFILPSEAIRGALFRSGRSGAFARPRTSEVVELISPEVPMDSLAYRMYNSPYDSSSEQSALLRRIQALLESADMNDSRQHTTSPV